MTTRRALSVIGMVTLALTLAVGLVWALGTAGTARADPGVIFVAPGGDCGEETPCYATVQSAVDAANPGDEILIAAGLYTDIHHRDDITQVVYISKTVTLRGGYTTDNWTTPNPMNSPTTLDALGQGRVLYANGDGTILEIEGLRITGGNALAGTGRTTSDGEVAGGVYIRDANATISGCMIYSNTARTGSGATIYSSLLTATNNMVVNNEAYDPYLSGRYAGLLANGDTTAYLIHNTFAGNSGIGVTAGSGGSTLFLTNTIIASNERGAGAYGGLAQINLNNTLWWDNGSDTGGWGTIVRNGDIYGDPDFVNPAGIDYHVGTDSAAIDVGVDAGVVVDIDGQGRSATDADVGADEYVVSYGLSLSPNRDGAAQPGDVIVYTHTLQNTGASSDTYQVVLDSSWGTLLTPSSVPLGPGEESTVRVQVSPPGGAIAGSLHLGTITASSSATGLFRSAYERTAVEMGGTIQLAPEHLQITLPAGEDVVTCVHTLANNVNHTQTVSLAASSTRFTATLQSGQMLAPFAEEGIAVTVTVPANTEDGVTDTVAITATGNLMGSAVAYDVIEVGAREEIHHTYLPLISRNFPPLIADAPQRCPGYGPVDLGLRYREDFDWGNDNDYWRFEATAGQTYTIDTDELEGRADTVLTLFAPDCRTPLAQNDDVSWPDTVSSRIVWQAPVDGTYHAMVRSYDWEVYGSDTGYSFRVTTGGVGESAAAAEGSEEKPLPPLTPTPEPERPPGHSRPLFQKPTPPPTPQGGGPVTPTPEARPTKIPPPTSAPLLPPTATPTVMLLPVSGAETPATVLFVLAALVLGIGAFVSILRRRR